MQHVMVPCPEEHVAELRAGLIALSLGSAGWSDEGLDSFLSGLDEQAHRLVVAVARPSSEDGHLTYRAAAASLGVEVGDVLDLVTTINDDCHRASLPLPLVTETKEVRDAGGDVQPTPVISIFRNVAQRILAHSGIQVEPVTSP